MKKTFYTEWCYVLGVVFLAMGTAIMEKAELGVSMVVAPALILYTKLNEIWSFFTFGMAEYLLQFVLIIILTIVMRKFKRSYVLSFVTTIIYGIVLDIFMFCFEILSTDILYLKIAFYVIGLLTTSFAVSLMFKTYISPAVYELFVKEVTTGYNLKMVVVKTTYDCASCIIAILMSFILFGFGNFVGVNIGTIICALVNGLLINTYTKILNKIFEFKDGTKLYKIYN